MKQAEQAGLEDTGEAFVAGAKAKVRRDTDDLYNSIEVQQGQAFSTGHGYVIEVGSDQEGVNHAAIQELGPADGREYGYTPYILPTLDEEGPNLAGNIKKRF